jgi:hypothetical protein
LDNHWSLMAVFSLLMVSVVVDVHEEDPNEMEWPALIFLDSLRMHNATAITKRVRVWLNHESAKKINAETTLNIFNEQSIRLCKLNGKSLYGY